MVLTRLIEWVGHTERDEGNVARLAARAANLELGEVRCLGVKDGAATACAQHAGHLVPDEVCAVSGVGRTGGAVCETHESKGSENPGLLLLCWLASVCKRTPCMMHLRGRCI